MDERLRRLEREAASDPTASARLARARLRLGASVWSREPWAESRDLLAVHVDAKGSLYVGGRSLMARRDAEGWRSYDERAQDAVSIAGWDEVVCFLTGRGTVYRSEAGGPLRARRSGVGWSAISIACPQPETVVVAGRGRVAVSLDGGLSYELRRAPLVLWSLHVLADGRLLGCGREALWVSEDLGASWSELARVPRSAVQSFAQLGEDWFVLTSDWDRDRGPGPAEVLVSSDEGRTWTTRLEREGQLSALVSDGRDGLWVAGDRGTLLGSLDGGASWTEVETRTLVDLGALCADREGRVWAGGAGGLLLSNDQAKPTRGEERGEERAHLRWHGAPRELSPAFEEGLELRALPAATPAHLAAIVGLALGEERLVSVDAQGRALAWRAGEEGWALEAELRAGGAPAPWRLALGPEEEVWAAGPAGLGPLGQPCQLSLPSEEGCVERLFVGPRWIHATWSRRQLRPQLRVWERDPAGWREHPPLDDLRPTLCDLDDEGRALWVGPEGVFSSRAPRHERALLLARRGLRQAAWLAAGRLLVAGASGLAVVEVESGRTLRRLRTRATTHFLLDRARSCAFLSEAQTLTRIPLDGSPLESLSPPLRDAPRQSAPGPAGDSLACGGGRGELVVRDASGAWQHPAPAWRWPRAGKARARELLSGPLAAWCARGEHLYLCQAGRLLRLELDSGRLEELGADLPLATPVAEDEPPQLLVIGESLLLAQQERWSGWSFRDGGQRWERELPFARAVAFAGAAYGYQRSAPHPGVRARSHGLFRLDPLNGDCSALELPFAEPPQALGVGLAAARSGLVFDARRDHQLPLFLFDPGAGELVELPGLSAPVSGNGAPSPCGRYLGWVERSGWRVRDLSTSGAPLLARRALPHQQRGLERIVPDPARGRVVTLGGERLAVWNLDGTLRALAAAPARRLDSAPPGDASPDELFLSPDGRSASLALRGGGLYRFGLPGQSAPVRRQ